MNLQGPFTATSEQIQAEIAKMNTKAEILAYLNLVGDFVGSTKKITRALMKGMK